jgi:hypothetical protein
MADRWLCLIDGQKIGPVKFSRLQQLAEAGRLKAHDYVRPEDQEQWSSAHEIADLFPATEVTPETAERQPTAETAGEKRRHSGPLPVARSLGEDVTVATPKLKRGTPLGTAVAPPVSSAVQDSKSEFPLFVSKDDQPSAHSGSTHAIGRKPKRSNTLPLMIGGSAIVGVLGLVLLLVLSGVIDLSGGTKEVAASTPAKKPKADDGIAVEEDSEANPTETKDESNKEPGADKTAKSADGKHPLLKTVERFNDITKGSPKLRGSGIKVGVSGLWLSSSESGTPATGGETPKYLVVKVKIDNPAGAAPLEYKGWGDEAVLFDAADKATQPLPTPDQIAKQSVAPGSSLVDTLVFPLENVEFETLRLALPHATIGVKDSKSFGMEVPRHALGRGLDTQLAGRADPAISARKTPGESEEEIVDKVPAANSVPMPMLIPMKAAAKPNDDDDIDRKLEERAKLLDKMEKEQTKK